MSRGLGRLELALLAWTQLRGLRSLRGGELRAPLRLSVVQERTLLSRMAKAGLIVRVWRGVNLVPPRLALGGRWTPDEAQALTALMASRGARYQVSGPNAFNRYGFDNQVPSRLHAYNDRLSGERTIGAVAMTLVRVAPTRLGDTEEVTSADGVTVSYSSRARALVDAVYDWSRFNGLPRAFDWIRAELTTRRIEAAELARVTRRYGNTGTIRRIGALLAREGVAEPQLRRLERALAPTSALIAWDPTRPRRGSVDRRWGVVLNERS